MNNFLKLFTTLIFSLILLSCTTNLPSTSRKAEETNIYSVLLNQDPQGYIGDSPGIIIVDKTVTYMASFSDSEENGILEDLPTLEKETLVDFRRINQREEILKFNLSLKKPYEIISLEEIDKRKSENSDNWLTTYTTTSFSGIGFNKTLTQAFVYMEHYCGGECATGDWYFLIRDKNGWKVENILQGWVS